MIALALLVVAVAIHGLMLYALFTVKDYPGMWRTPYDR